MKKILLLGLLIVCGMFAQSPVFGQDEAAKPSYKNGEVWLFSFKQGGSTGSSSNLLPNGNYEVAMADGKLKVAAVNGSQKEDLEPRPAPLMGMLAVGSNLNFPLTVGKKWSRDYKAAYVGQQAGKEIARTISYEIKGIESVTTPAGTFRAFKLESDDRNSARDYWTTTFWYSPETKSIVKSVFDSSAGGQVTGLQREIELIKFTPAK